MRNKLARFVMVCLLAVSLLAPAGRSQAAASGVRVTLSPFKVKLNGHVVENQYRKYPLLVHNDITYVPMTWYDSRLLGLESGWSPEKGLNIVQADVTSSYEPYKSEFRNGGVYYADAPASAITINGKSIDNEKEKYPLLSFRDVTYFPLTWRFAHDEFGWDYQWDLSEGLTIQSHNAQVQTVDLPAVAGENDVALFKGYYYFVETAGSVNHVYRARVKDPSVKEEIYKYDLDSLNKALSFQIRDNELWFTYHVGGALMGHDVYVKVNDEGKAAVMHQGYLDFRKTAYGTLVIDRGVPPAGNNLYIVAPGQERQAGKSAGNPDLMYGRHVHVSETGIGVGGDDSSTVVIGDEAYVLGSSYPKDNLDLNKIYKINLKTNKTEKIVNAEVSRFRVARDNKLNDKLYYVKDADNSLYSSALDGTGEQELSDQPAAWFDSIKGNVYYTTSISSIKVIR